MNFQLVKKGINFDNDVYVWKNPDRVWLGHSWWPKMHINTAQITAINNGRNALTWFNDSVFKFYLFLLQKK